MRSLITLKALTYAPTGGIVAAPTTSLPEKLGGQRNWDYRFCWLRDATFTLLALMNSGYTEEASAWHNWLLRAAAGSPANMQIMYGIMGQRRLLEWEAGWLPGYEGAQPVRVGNAAHAQLQLDVYGELIDAFHQSRMAKLKLDEGILGAGMRGARSSRRSLGPAGSRHLGAARRRQALCLFEGDDLGRVRPRHQERREIRLRGAARALAGACATPSAAMSARRVSIASRMRSSNPTARNCSMPASCCCRRWASCRPPIRASAARIAAIEKHMMRDGFVLRHDPREVSEEKQPIEGAFLACSSGSPMPMCWPARSTKAQALFDRVVAVANDLGLLAEEYDSGAGRQTGNFPQALTHIALINTAHNLSDARQASGEAGDAAVEVDPVVPAEPDP